MADAPYRLPDVAVSHMRLALPLLGRANDALAAARLRQVVTSIQPSPYPQFGRASLLDMGSVEVAAPADHTK